MTDSDDRRPPDERPGSDGARRAFLGRAEPTPVTEAMIRPRTTPSGPDEVPDVGGVPDIEVRICHSCGEQNDPGGSYCLACGVRLLRRGAQARPREARDEPIASELTSDRAVVGVTDLPPPYWDEGEGPPGASGSVSAAQRRSRLLLVMVVVIAIAFLGFNMLQSRGAEQTEQEEPSTTTTAAADEAALRSYVDDISVLADDVAELTATGRRINDAWHDRIADYDTTRDQMNALSSRAGVLPDRLSAVAPPEGADTVVHQRMIGFLSTLASAAEGMMVGLESSDSGEARLSQLVRFEDAASEFGRLAEQVERSLESLSKVPDGSEGADQ